MKFKVVKFYGKDLENNTVYLILDNWNDWFTYQTLYNINYKDKYGELKNLGFIKIGQENQGRSPKLPETFEKLPPDFFSIGSGEEYYEALKELDPNGKLRKEILKALNDIAFNLELYNRAVEHDVVKTSLLRDITDSMVRNQYNRIATGGAWLTSYNFSYIPSGEYNPFNENKDVLDFEIDPEDIPPTNIHVLIGKNGVGKTTILRNMLSALESDSKEYGIVNMWSTHEFANILYISFSAFDRYIIIENEKIPYLYIGLVKDNGIKDSDELSKDFAESLFEITSGNKKELWEKTIAILESDYTFTDLNIRSWTAHNTGDLNSQISKNKKIERLGLYNKNILKNNFIKKVIPKFEKLSSGHKVILLTVAKLIDKVEEKTLVLMDEPEEHLHPPLVSAFIRALSNLLIYRNGTGIISTHSPVIVQEVPRKCVWILRRVGDVMVAERPQIETFGENLGILTSEIFGYEVTCSGFHLMIKEAADKNSTYKRALNTFHGQLGNEGKAMLRSFMYEKENVEEENND